MFARSLDVNLKGPFFLIQSLLPVFANPASVVLNTSINAHVGAARSSVYAASKAALLSLSKTLSSELLEREILASIPAGRFGLAEEVASAVLHLASDESAWSVGSEIVVDGGRMLNG